MFLYRILRAIVAPICKILWPTKIIHRENYNKMKNGGIVVCNHYGSPDSVIIACEFFKKELSVLTKADFFTSKFIGWFLRSVGCIPVKRGEADIDAYKSVLRSLHQNKNVLIFPEGTRNKQGTKVLAPLKNGVASFAIKTNKPILPMMFYRDHKIFRKNYLIVGEPFYLNEEGFNRRQLNEATAFIGDKMYEIREELDNIAEGRNS